MVDRFISQLKRGKSAGLDNLTAEHLQFAHPLVVKLISKLFNLMILFEYVPDAFGRGVMVPIPKDKGGKGSVSTDEYRGISINPIVSKLFESCLLTLFSKYFESSSSQFGFKAKTGCNHALYTVRKTIDFFIERESTVNLCSLDLSKAFDKMNRHALYIKLMNRNCPLVLIQILDCWYSKCFACVRWSGVISPFFQLFSGIRQGGVISPTLFAVNINDVIVKLQKSS